MAVILTPSGLMTVRDDPDPFRSYPTTSGSSSTGGSSGGFSEDTAAREAAEARMAQERAATAAAQERQRQLQQQQLQAEIESRKIQPGELTQEEKTSLPVVLVVVSIAAFIIYGAQNKTSNYSDFLLWLPAAWMLVFCLMCGFKLFLSEKW